MGIILACCIFQFGGKVSPFLSKSLNRSFSCLSSLALNGVPLGLVPYTLFWQRGLLYYSPYTFSRTVAHSSDSPSVKALIFTHTVCTCYIATLSIAHLKAICVRFSAHSVHFIFRYSSPQKHFCELDILCVIVLCQNNSVHRYRNVRETQWTPQQSKSPSLVTDLEFNLRICQHTFKFLPDTASDNIVGTLGPNAVFPLLVLLLSLSKLFIAVQSPNLVHQH